MDTADDIVFIMNIMLYARQFDQKQFQKLLNKIREQYHLKIGMLDFEFYNETNRKEIVHNKIKAIKDLDFEKALSYREQEKLCFTFKKFSIDLKLRNQFFIMKIIISYTCMLEMQGMINR